jgi:tRNA dimethylallyltransferase
VRQIQIILLAGPTASGKTRLGCALGARVGGVVVNADSMQVYRELSILTARPTPEEEAQAPHRLYGHVPATNRYSVGEWLRDVAPVVKDAKREQRPLVVVGGTGLYFKALTEGLAEVPAIPRDIATEVRADARSKGSEAMHARLARVDPDGAAAIRPSDSARIVRAIEVYEATGRPLSEWQRAAPAKPVISQTRATRIVLAPEPAVLHERISARAEAMVGNGALKEVAALDALGLDPELPVMKAIGVRELAAHLRGDTSLDEAVAAVKTETRRYAKRQMTWFRGQMRDWQWVRDPGALDLAELAP